MRSSYSQLRCRITQIGLLMVSIKEATLDTASTVSIANKRLLARPKEK
jgi:hypothetical protein